MSRRTKHRSRLFGFLGLALLLHINLIVLAAFIISLFPERWQTRDTPLKPIDVALVPAEELRQEQQLAGLEALKREELKKEEKKEEEKDKDLKGQVVDIAPPAEERQPDKARFLSEYDSRVAKEKKGPVMPTTPGRLMASRPPPQPRQPLPPEQREEVERKAMQLAMREPSDGRREGPRGEVPQAEVPRSDLPKDHGGDEPSKPDELPKQGGGDGRVAPGGAPPGKRLTMDDLRLTDQELGRAVGGRANDYLKDVDEGEETLLNTKRWRFATFFNRVKRQVAQNWHPDVVYRRRDPSGNVYGFRDRLTIIRVQLTPDGKLRQVQLEKPCGVGFLDDEAISAFRAAEPFPNPPQGLIDKETGMISFRFGFLFEISSRPGFRVFRFND